MSPPRRTKTGTLARLLDMLSSVLAGGRGIQVRRLGHRLVIEAPYMEARREGAVIRRFRVKSEENDYLVCRSYNAGAAAGAEGTEDINVAKPYELRRTPFAGETITYPGGQNIEYTYTQHYERTADDGSDSETQVMTPRYWVDCEILAVRSIFGGTGVTVSGVVLAWQDINTAGRFWAKET